MLAWRSRLKPMPVTQTLQSRTSIFFFSSSRRHTRWICDWSSDVCSSDLGLVNFFSFEDVDRAACVSVETRVEETGRILQRRALGEGKLHDILVGFASADDAVVRPNRSAHPLPLLDDVRVCFLDELAHSAEGFPAPVPELGDSFRDELRCRLALGRARLFHVLILEVPDIFHLQRRRMAGENRFDF